MMGEDNYNYDSIAELKELEELNDEYDEYFERIVCPEIKAFDWLRDEENTIESLESCAVYITFHKLNGIIHMKKVVLFDDKTWQELNILENGEFKYDVPEYKQ